MSDTVYMSANQGSRSVGEGRSNKQLEDKNTQGHMFGLATPSSQELLTILSHGITSYWSYELWYLWYNPSGENERKTYPWVSPVPHLSKCPLLGCETFCIFRCMTSTSRQPLGGVCLRLVNSGGSRESYMVPMIGCQQQELSRGRVLGKRKCVPADLS